MGLSYGDTVYDAGVAAYLLNPLKDTYEYDDIARDYLGISVPSRGDLLKKMTFEAAWEQEPKAALVCAGYMAYTRIWPARRFWKSCGKREWKSFTVRLSFR